MPVSVQSSIADAGHASLKSPATELLKLSDPFAGLVGHCFLYLCKFVTFAAGLIQPLSAPAEVAAESLLKAPNHATLKYLGSCSLGTLCCTVAAGGLTPLFFSSSIKSFLPFGFLIIVVLVAFHFGRAAGVLGTISAALLFAAVLFEPIPSLAVSDPAARNHLIWMVIIGIVVSDLSARLKQGHMASHQI